MTTTGEEKIRGMIRLIPPASALKNDLEKALHLELHAGAGDMAVKTYGGLHESVAALADDPYVNALSIDLTPGLTDRDKIGLVVLMAGQIEAYLKGQTGVAGTGEAGGNHSINIQSAPNLNGNNIKGIGAGDLGALLGLREPAAGSEEEPSNDSDGG
jgi:hypothetical protein